MIDISRLKSESKLVILLQSFFCFLAKRFYKTEYLFLKSSLPILKDFVFHKTDITQFTNLDLMLIVGEDHRFYKHFGFDIIAIIRALKNNLFSKRKQGASTIEQQLVRVVLNDYSRTYKRKIKEILLASTVSTIIRKAEIPWVYLFIAFYGSKYSSLVNLIEKIKMNYNTSDIELFAEIVSRIKYPENLNNQASFLKISKRKTFLIKKFSKFMDNQSIK